MVFAMRKTKSNTYFPISRNTFMMENIDLKEKERKYLFNDQEFIDL